MVAGLGGAEGLNGGTSITLNAYFCLALSHDTSSKKFAVTVNFFQKEAQTAPKRPILLCLVYQGISAMFLQFWIISEDSRRLPKISEGYRRGIKIAEDRPKIVRRTLRKLSPETKNPPETVNKKIGQFNSKH